MNNNVAIAETYYTAMSNKDIVSLEQYLHHDVQFTSPFATLAGKPAMFEAIRKFTTYFKTLNIRATFGSGDQAIAVYNVEFSEPI